MAPLLSPSAWIVLPKTLSCCGSVHCVAASGTLRPFSISQLPVCYDPLVCFGRGIASGQYRLTAHDTNFLL